MFDFAWSEIALIGVVALVAIGPKDMPVAIKTLSELVKKARRMAGEFQTHVDEMVRDANLHEVRGHINDIRSLNIRGTIARAVDGDGSIRRAFTENPLEAPAGAVPQPPSVIGLPDSSEAQASLAALQPSTAVPGLAAPEASAAPPTFTPPAFTPPAVAPTAAIPAPAFIPPAAAVAPATAVAAPVPPPAFIPPAFIPPAAALAEASPVPAASGAAPAG